MASNQVNLSVVGSSANKGAKWATVLIHQVSGLHVSDHPITYFVCIAAIRTDEAISWNSLDPPRSKQIIWNNGKKELLSSGTSSWSSASYGMSYLGRSDHVKEDK